MTSLLCSEQELSLLASSLATSLKAQDRVILEGPLGAGKSTFARYLLEHLKVQQKIEGSPSFAIAHEYLSPLGKIVHLDLYRIQSELELEERGIYFYYWESPFLVISEWLSLWPQFEEKVYSSQNFWKIQFTFTKNLTQRLIKINSPHSILRGARKND